MSGLIEVNPGERKSIDFSADTIIYTRGLEACLGIGAVHGQQGFLMHLRQNDPVEEYMDWFSGRVHRKNTRVYLAGGMEGKAEDFVREVRKKMRGYRIAGEKVLTEYFIDFWLYETKASVDIYRQMKSSKGMEFFCMGSEEL